MDYAKIKKIIDGALFLMVAVFLVSGFGIVNAEFRNAIGLEKSLAFNMHLMITWPFIIVLILHIFYFRMISFLRK
ncbi:MAG: DUF4405 domain-containing protein [Candidatus Diapherotrites archaeon]|nr:DUF4405 domain-containing protein [Candidatus Diapherotrites archaeon]